MTDETQISNKQKRSLGMKTRFPLLSWSGLIPLLLLGFGLVGCGPSQKDLDKAIGDYLQKNPQVIQKAVQAQAPQRAPELSLEERIKKAIRVDLNNAPTQGAENAPVTIVEFSDFQCPFCARVLPTVKRLLQDYPGKIRFAFRQNPLPMHENAMSAAKASLSANEQGKFWELHDLLFENQKTLTDETIRKLAKQIGLNMSKFEKDWKSERFDAQIASDMNFAKSNQAGGTPAFFINGVLMTGARPIGSFKEVIDKLLEAK